MATDFLAALGAKSPKVKSGRGILLCLIGPPGIGKTSLISCFPNRKMIVDRRDQGILDLLDYSDATGVSVPRSDIQIVSSFDELKGAAAAAMSCSAPTICFESLVGIQTMCEQKALVTDYNNNPQFFAAFQNGKDTAGDVYFQQVLDTMVDLQNSGKNVILTGHSKVGKAKNITGEDWVSQVLDTSASVSRRLNATFATILHIGQVVSTAAPSGKQRATGMTTNIYTTLNTAFPAKNRMGLIEPITFESSAEAMWPVLAGLFKLDPKTGIRL